MSQLDSVQDLRNHLTEALVRMHEWHAGEGGLMLSANASEELLQLRTAVRQYLEKSAHHDQLEQAKHDIWSHRNRLREAMRADLGLLFDEDR